MNCRKTFLLFYVQGNVELTVGKHFYHYAHKEMLTRIHAVNKCTSVSNAKVNIKWIKCINTLMRTPIN